MRRARTADPHDRHLRAIGPVMPLPSGSQRVLESAPAAAPSAATIVLFAVVLALLVFVALV